MTCLHDHHASDPTGVLHSRRAIVTALGAAAMLAAARPVAAADASAEDERFMRMALDEARQADFPFGAVIVRDGPGYRAGAQSRKNQRRSDRARRNGGDPPLPCRPWQCGAQGEYALHVRRAVRDVHGRDRLVPLRPAGLCRLGTSRSPRGSNQIMISSADVAAKDSFLPIKITGGVLADEAVQLFGK